MPTSPDARPPTPGAALTNAILGPQLSGLPAEPGHRAALTDMMKAIGLPEGTQITDRNAAQIEARVLRHLGQLGVDVGNPPSLEKARENMISALQGQPGMSREELGNATLTDLMNRMKGLREQQRPGQQDRVDPNARRAQPSPGGADRTPRAVPPRPRQPRGVQPGGRQHVPRQRVPAQPQRATRADPVPPREGTPLSAREVGDRINNFWRGIQAGAHTAEHASTVGNALRERPDALRFVAPEVRADLERLATRRPAELRGGH